MTLKTTTAKPKSNLHVLIAKAKKCYANCGMSCAARWANHKKETSICHWCEKMEKPRKRIHLELVHNKSNDNKQENLIKSISNEYLEAEQEAEKLEIGYCCRYLIQATLPHSKPADDVTEFERSNGNIRVNIKAQKRYGLPYGRYPRQILAWIGREAKITSSPEINIGSSLREFVESKLKRKYGSGKRGSGTIIKEQLIRLATSDIQATHHEAGKWHNRRLSPIDETVLFWDPNNHERIIDWQATIRLDGRFFQELIEHPVPVNLHTLSTFKSSLEIDIYCWLTYRMSYLKKPMLIPWEALQVQFGSNYDQLKKDPTQGRRNFKKAFIQALKNVLKEYKTAKATPYKTGLSISPSPTDIPFKLLKNR